MVAFRVVILVAEHAADLGLYAEGWKISAGDKLHLHRLGLGSTVYETVDFIHHAENGGGVREDRVFLLQLAIERIRVEISVDESVADACHFPFAQKKQLLRVFDRQGAEHDRDPAN